MSYAPFESGFSNLTIFSNGSTSKYSFDAPTSKLYRELTNKKESLFGKYLSVIILCVALVSASIIALGVLSSNNKKSLLYIIGFIGLILVGGICMGMFFNQSQRVYIFGFIGLVLVGGFAYLYKLTEQDIAVSKQIARLLKSSQVS